MSNFRFIKCKDKRYHRGVSYILAEMIDGGFKIIGMPYQYFAISLSLAEVEEILPMYNNFKIVQETYLPKDFNDHNRWVSLFGDITWEYGIYVGNIKLLTVEHEYNEISPNDRFSCSSWYPNFDSRNVSKDLFEFLTELDNELTK